MSFSLKIDRSDAGLANTSRIVLLILSALFFAWIFWNIRNAVPSADDFCYGAGNRERGPLANVVFEYFNWGGRYSATLLISLFAGAETLLLGHYYLVPVVILALNLWATWHLLRSIGLKSPAFFVLFMLMLMATFRMRESLLWLSGGATYGVACALLLALIAEYWKIACARAVLTTTRAVILAAGAVFLAGLNEVSSLAHLVIVGLTTISVIAHQRKNRLIVLVALAAIIGAAIAISAPGNYVRAAGSMGSDGIVAAFGTSLLMVFSKYAVPAILHTVLFVAFLWACQTSRPSGIDKRHLLAFIACMALALWAGIFPRAYALHELGPERARTIDFLLLNLIALSIAVLLHDRRRIRSRQPRPVLASVIFGGMALLVTGVAVAPQKTILPLWADMGESLKLRTLIDERQELARNAAGQSLVVTAYTQEKKPITYFNEIRTDPKEWENVCLAKYFNLKDVRAQ